MICYFEKRYSVPASIAAMEQNWMTASYFVPAEAWFRRIIHAGSLNMIRVKEYRLSRNHLISHTMTKRISHFNLKYIAERRIAKQSCALIVSIKLLYHCSKLVFTKDRYPELFCLFFFRSGIFTDYHIIGLLWYRSRNLSTETLNYFSCFISCKTR